METRSRFALALLAHLLLLTAWLIHELLRWDGARCVVDLVDPAKSDARKWEMALYDHHFWPGPTYDEEATKMQRRRHLMAPPFRNDDGKIDKGEHKSNFLLGVVDRQDPLFSNKGRYRAYKMRTATRRTTTTKSPDFSNPIVHVVSSLTFDEFTEPPLFEKFSLVDNEFSRKVAREEQEKVDSPVQSSPTSTIPASTTARPITTPTTTAVRNTTEQMARQSEEPLILSVFNLISATREELEHISSTTKSPEKEDELSSTTRHFFWMVTKPKATTTTTTTAAAAAITTTTATESYSTTSAEGLPPATSSSSPTTFPPIEHIFEPIVVTETTEIEPEFSTETPTSSPFQRAVYQETLVDPARIHRTSSSYRKRIWSRREPPPLHFETSLAELTAGWRCALRALLSSLAVFRYVLTPLLLIGLSRRSIFAITPAFVVDVMYLLCLGLFTLVVWASAWVEYRLSSAKWSGFVLLGFLVLPVFSASLVAILIGEMRSARRLVHYDTDKQSYEALD